MSADAVTMAYAGSLPCGCIVAVITDKPEHARENAREVAKWMRDGLTIDRRTVADLKADPAFIRNCGGDAHRRKPREKAQQIGAGL